MNSNSATQILGNVTLSVDERPLALQLPVGAALFAIRGTVWLTQEGRFDDIVLTPGERFNVSSRAQVLVSAIHGGAVVHVAAPSDAASSAVADIHDFARVSAQHLRRAELARLRHAATAHATAWLARVRTALAPHSTLANT